MNELKILVVDDEETVLFNIKYALKEYNVVIESSPMEAVRLIEHTHFDIILTDYNMPMINGIEFFEEVKEIYKKKPYVGILCTAYGTTYLFEQEQAHGLFRFFLEKPIKTEKLMEVVAQAVTRLKKVCANEK